MNGIFLLDKPIGISSNSALQKVKRIFRAKKAGHTGSLDPLATGMLPICFGEATKFSQYLLDADKTYLVTAELGIQTATGDAEGEVLQKRDSAAVTKEKLLAVLPQFRGEIMQVPSMYSALKHQGKPLYEFARQGISIDRPARPIHIYSLELLDFAHPYFAIKVHCSKGTYIRTLVEDMGEALGCGAYVKTLRRLQVSNFVEEQMLTLEKLAITPPAELQQFILPLEVTLNHFQNITIPEAATFFLLRGQPVQVPHAPVSGWVKLTSSSGAFLGVGEIIADGKIAPRRLIQTNN